MSADFIRQCFICIIKDTISENLHLKIFLVCTDDVEVPASPLTPLISTPSRISVFSDTFACPGSVHSWQTQSHALCCSEEKGAFFLKQHRDPVLGQLDEVPNRAYRLWKQHCNAKFTALRLPATPLIAFFMNKYKPKFFNEYRLFRN